MISKAASSTLFWVFGMTRPRIEPWSNSLLIRPMVRFLLLLWPRKGSLMKTQTRILDNRLYYTRKIELHRKGKSRTVRITSIVICPLAAKSLVLVTVRRVHYRMMAKVPSTVIKLFISNQLGLLSIRRKNRLVLIRTFINRGDYHG